MDGWIRPEFGFTGVDISGKGKRYCVAVPVVSENYTVATNMVDNDNLSIVVDSDGQWQSSAVNWNAASWWLPLMHRVVTIWWVDGCVQA